MPGTYPYPMDPSQKSGSMISFDRMELLMIKKKLTSSVHSPKKTNWLISFPDLFHLFSIKFLKTGIPSQLEPFVHEHTIVARAPGRINLIGEHTDYNEGFVLP